MISRNVYILRFAVLIHFFLLFFKTFLFLTPPAFASPLSEAERNSLRYHLQNLLNEETLVVRNHPADLMDLRRLKRDFTSLKVLQRIPFKRNLAQLKHDLESTARLHQITLKHFKLTGYSGETKKPPQKIYTDDPPFHFQPEQLVELIYFQAEVSSPTEEQVTKWINLWPSEQLRVTELEHIEKKSQDGTWIVYAHAFRFRKARFPTLLPRNPALFLPDWAQKKPSIFASTEPILWKLVKQIQAARPQSIPNYQSRGLLLLKNARMDFFLSKVIPS